MGGVHSSELAQAKGGGRGGGGGREGKQRGRERQEKGKGGRGEGERTKGKQRGREGREKNVKRGPLSLRGHIPAQRGPRPQPPLCQGRSAQSPCR